MKHRQLIGLLIILFAAFAPARADRIDDLREEIEQKGREIEELDREIRQYEQELVEIGTEKRTLETAVAELDLSHKKLSTDIERTEHEIDATTYTIETIEIDIDDKERVIGLNTDAIAESIRRIHETESQSLIETVLAYDNLSDAWGTVDTLEQFQVTLRNDLDELRQLKSELEGRHVALIAERDELAALQTDLTYQRSAVAENRSEKNTLLTATKSEEANYQALLAEKMRQRELFEQELRAIEAALQVEIDPGHLPDAAAGVLRWPLDAVRVTQHFGNTAFATANPQVYGGRGHNGIDLGASMGTQVKSALSGTVSGTGDTDLQNGCYSYGKWVLIRHDNGLSSLYAHLSRISVTEGERVATGQTIGLSGNTGYSTGPHLHFTVFASEGVTVRRLGDVKAVTNCGNVSIPIAPLDAYLNPLSYLPSL